MDNYSLEEVKMLIEKNMLTGDILKNIFTSTTRRIDLYDTKECIDILKYLATQECVPDDTKEEIDKYLAEYNSLKIVEQDTNIINKETRDWKIVLLYASVIILIAVGVILFVL